MPGPFQVSTAAHPIVSQGGPQGPFEGTGAIYCFAFSDATTLEAYSSTDGGETWSATGETRTIGTVVVQTFGACLSVAEDAVYVLYVTGGIGDQHLEVSRFDLATGTFTDTSAQGPELLDNAGVSPLLYIEESTDGGFGILTKTFYLGSNAHAAICTLSGDLGTWSSLSEPAGQADSDLLFNACGIARGLDGRVHGFVRQATISTDEHSLHHVLVLGAGGGIGTAFDEIAAEIDNEDFQISAAALDDGTIGVVYNAPDVGVGTVYKLSSAIATSADTPSWSYADIDASAAADAGVNAGLIGGSTFRAVWSAGGSLRVSTYGGSWDGFTIVAPTAAGAISGRQLTSSFGFFYTDFSDDPLPSFYILFSGGSVPYAYSQWVNSGRYGPWSWGGALFSVVFSNVADDQDNDYDFVPVLKLIKSTDGGGTWVDVALETIDFSDDLLPEDFAYAPETFGTCQDVDFATNGYVYVAYPGTDQHLYVKRLNLDDEIFDATSVQGPELVAYSDAAAGVATVDPPHILIEQNSDGKFALMWQRPAGVAVDPLQVYIVDLAGDLSAWGTATKVNGQSSGKAYSPYALLRGDSQRVHGLLWERDGTALALYHTLVLNTSGSLVGTTWDSVWAETHASGHAPGILNGAPVACLSYDAAGTQTLVVLYTDNQGVGIGGPYYRLRAAIAASANTPSWSHSTVYDDSATSFFFTATLTQDPSGDPLAVFAPIAPKGDLASATWNGSTWDAGASYEFTAERLAATPDGIWFIRQAEASYDTEYSYPLYFDDLSTITGGGGGGGEQILTGSTIATGERFYNTSGVTGGGIDGCGTNVPVVADNSCNPVDPDTAIDAPGECVPQGYSY